jgi:hypothetical protein
MSKITTDMVRVFNQRLDAIGSPWSIVEGEYEGADYSQQLIVDSVNPTLAPFLVDQLTYRNLTDVEQSVVLSVDKNTKLTRSLTVSSSFKMGVALKLEFSVGVVKVEAGLNLEQTWGSSNTETTEEGVVIKFEQPVRVPPKTLVTMQTLIQLQTVTDLPFELRVLLKNGKFGVVPRGTVPLHRYYNGSEHFYTRSASAPAGFVDEGIACHVSNVQGPSMVPLYRYMRRDGNYHFYTTDPNEVDGNAEWLAEGNEGYVFPSAVPGTIPLYRYYNGDYHFYTTDFGELGSGRDGWVFESVQAHVAPPRITDPALLRSVQALFPNNNDRLFIIPGHYEGKSTNRKIDILMRSEPTTDVLSVRGKEPVERTPDHEQQAWKLSPGDLVDLRQSA